MAPRTKAHDVARQWMQDNPGVPSRTAARHLCKLRPKLFTSVEQARGVVRLIVGQAGDAGRKTGVKDKSLFRKPGKQGDAKIELPKGLTEFKPPIEINGPRKVLILSDPHVPYHDERAIDKAVNYGIQQGCDTLYLNGDFIDFYQISNYEKDPENRGLDYELETAELILEQIGKPFKSRYFKVGNHDDRWQRYLWRNAPALGKVAKMRLDAVLELKEKGYEFVQSKQWAKLGKLDLLHGHELQGSSPVNPARGAYLKAGSTVAVGHHHRTSEHAEKIPLNGQLVVTWSTGCLCDMRPAYAVLNRWNLGFAICEIERSGDFSFENFKIDNTRGHKIYR